MEFEKFTYHTFAEHTINHKTHTVNLGRVEHDDRPKFELADELLPDWAASDEWDKKRQEYDHHYSVYVVRRDSKNVAHRIIFNHIGPDAVSCYKAILDYRKEHDI
jgi:hypothetical protein